MHQNDCGSLPPSLLSSSETLILSVQIGAGDQLMCQNGGRIFFKKKKLEKE
jgi:hypothetical protein